MRDAYSLPGARSALLSRRSLLGLGRVGASRKPVWRSPALLAHLDGVREHVGGGAVSFFGDPPAAAVVAAAAAGEAVTIAHWAPRGLPGALAPPPSVPDGLVDLAVGTLAVQLCFDDADACYEALVAPAHRHAGIRDTFDRLLAAQNNRPPTVEIDARYVLVTGVRA